MQNSEDKAPRRYELKPKTFERLNAEPGTQAHSDDHDVYAIRRDLRAREMAAGLDATSPKPAKMSRRKKDYLLLMIAGNLLFLTFLVNGRGNVMVMVYSFSGMILYSISVSWIMWQIMSDY